MASLKRKGVMGVVKWRGGRSDSGVGWTLRPRRVWGAIEPASALRAARGESGHQVLLYQVEEHRHRYRDQHGRRGHQVPLGVVLAHEALQTDRERVLRVGEHERRGERDLTEGG